VLLPKYASGLYSGFKSYVVRPAYCYALFSEALEEIPRGPAGVVVVSSFTTMFIDVGSSSSPSSRDETIKQALSDVYDVLHDFATDRSDLKVANIIGFG
jgi:hypothetical protein